MMKKLQKRTFILLIILFASCEKKVSELEFEKNVMTEIFPNLIDSTCFDSRLIKLLPPVGKAIYDKDDNDSLDVDGFIQTINQNFAAENEDVAEHIKEKLGTLFTRDDLESTKVKVEITIPLIELCKKINYDIINTYFNHEHQANISIDSSKSDYKSYIQNRNTQLLVAYLCKNQSLQIK